MILTTAELVYIADCVAQGPKGLLGQGVLRKLEEEIAHREELRKPDRKALSDTDRKAIDNFLTCRSPTVVPPATKPAPAVLTLEDLGL